MNSPTLYFMTSRLLLPLPFLLCMLAAAGTSSLSRQSNAATIAASGASQAAISAPMNTAARHLTTGTTAAMTASVSASDGWIRWLPANAPMAAYMQLTNRGNDPVTLVSASSPRFTQVMLHQSVDMGGMAQMRMVATLVLPPHQSVAIAPGGYHLMLLSPITPIAVGEQIKMTLRFSDGQVLDLTLPVSPPTRMH